MTKDTLTLHERMKSYEMETRTFLPKSRFIVIRLDGKAFHTYTKKFKKPFDNRIVTAFEETSKYLLDNVQSAVLVYTQSDEMTVVCRVDGENGQHWFNGNIQKITSTAASIATAKFNSVMSELYPDLNTFAFFDARVFTLSDVEVLNCLWWRQKDARKNAISAMAHAKFGHKVVQFKNSDDKIEMLGSDWDNEPIQNKLGFVVYKKTVVMKTSYNGVPITVPRRVATVDRNIPLFVDNFDYLCKKLNIEKVE